MTSQLSVFSTLIQEYPTWASLSEALLAKHLRLIPCTDEHVIVRYVKEVTDLTDEVCRAFRSVVWNTLTNRPVCMAPAKAVSGSPPPGKSLFVSNFVDGVMINVWCERDGQIHIASRSSYGAESNFYSPKSFALLFEEALGKSPQVFFAPLLKRGEFVNCVFTHPEHRTVKHHQIPAVYVVGMGSVSDTGDITLSWKYDDWPEALRSFYPTLFSFVNDMTFESPEKIQELLTSFAADSEWQGIMFQDPSSTARWRLRNPSYTLLRTLRGSESDPARRFLRLRGSGQVKQYLAVFREESQLFWDFESALRRATKMLAYAYTDVQKLKTKSFQDLAFALRPHVYALHGQYLKTSSPIQIDTVIRYVNSLGVDQQVQLLSLKVR